MSAASSSARLYWAGQYDAAAQAPSAPSQTPAGFSILSIEQIQAPRQVREEHMISGALHGEGAESLCFLRGI